MTISAATPYLAAASTADLEDWGPLDEATGPQMSTRGIELWVDGPASAGSGAGPPGPSHWTLETNEVIHVVAGRMTVTPDGGEPAEIGPGSVAVFPQGWSGTWQIHETLRKVYAIF